MEKGELVMKMITDLNELKAIELSVLKKVHQYCEENDIWYVLAYGTLLGTIRHNGFIPWDDDIDIFIRRKDFVKFEKEFPAWGKKHGLFLVGPNTQACYFPRDLLKVCDSRTGLLETAYKRDQPIGVFVDVWILDEVPEPSWRTKLWLFGSKLCRNINLAADIDWEYAKKNLKWKKRIVVRLMNWHRTQPLIRLQQKIAQKYDGKGAGKLICIQGNEGTYDEQDFKERILHRFEDAQFYIPKGYDKILRVVYGDYTQLPPVEMRKPHHVQNVWWI